MEIKMDFKNLASKIIDDVSGIKSTETSKHVEENDILEGLDLDFSETVSKNLSEDFDLDIEEIEPEQKVEQLFDGYLGEKNFDPNPLEYGPNAMYRKNGVVYRKSVDNLWEAYLKDGAQGPRGAAGGSGVGVQEVRREISSNPIVGNFSAESSYVASEKPVLTKYSLPTRYLDRPIRIATFGDSKADWVMSGPLVKTDTENWYVPITSANSSILFTKDKLWLKLRKNYIAVANGGRSGQSTSQMISRSRSAYTNDRRAIQDIISKKPDVMLFRGNLNDILLSINGNSTYEEIVSASNFYFNQYKQLVKLVTDSGIPVIDTGILGFSNLSATYTDIIRNRVLSCSIIKQLILNESLSDPLWRFLDCEGTIVENFRFLPGMSNDGIHMTEYGGFKLSELEDIEIRKLYVANTLNLTMPYDTIRDYANFTTTAGYAKPLNRNINLTNSLILSSSSVTLDKWNLVYETSSNSNTLQVSIVNFRAEVLSALTSGDNFFVRYKIFIQNTNGTAVDDVLFSRRFRPYTSANTNYIIYEDTFTKTVNGWIDYLAQNAMPNNSSTFGTSTHCYFAIANLPQGIYNITVYPEYVYKYVI